MNSVNLIGRAVAQPAIKYVGPTNRQLAEFTLAVDDPHGKKDDKGRKPCYFFYICIWGEKAEIAHTYITKGRRIGITGKLVQETFIPRGEDKPVTKTRIQADSFDLMDAPAGDTTPPSRTPAETPAMDERAHEPDDIPF
jgi:single-strand DNA-binding protein